MLDLAIVLALVFGAAILGAMLGTVITRCAVGRNNE